MHVNPPVSHLEHRGDPLLHFALAPRQLLHAKLALIPFFLDWEGLEAEGGSKADGRHCGWS